MFNYDDLMLFQKNSSELKLFINHLNDVLYNGDTHFTMKDKEQILYLLNRYEQHLDHLILDLKDTVKPRNISSSFETRKT